ncbi:FAD-dependent monooxygenase [Pseudonocardia xinjiangensis]|uniref:FAD-dependent monooxygenase n=1 Tax=Pseudonocardia xinjiangensis TaxID=75289 RepID=UPI003D8DD0D4
MTTVLIVGAGPTGLTLACDLARRGVEVRIIEKSPAFQTGSRGKTLNARSLEVLGDLGVADQVRASGITHLKFRKYFQGELVEETDPFEDRMLFVPQWRTEQVLRDRLATWGVQVELATELTDFTQDDVGVHVTLADGGRIEADYLVGCDGGRSPVRKLLGVAFEGETAPEQAMVCGDVVVDGLVDEAWHQWFAEDGAILLSPFRGTDSWQLQASPERDAAGEVLPPSLESFQRLFDRYARLPGVRLRDLTWKSTWTVNVRMVDRYRVGRVFLAGDAAHVHPIAGGLGMNTGIQDAWNLGWKLGLVATGHAGPALLDTYEEERMPIAAWTLDLTSERLRVVLDDIRIRGEGMDAVAVPEGSGLGINYRWSVLAEDHAPGERTTRAGDRAPNVPLRGSPEHTPRRLFDLLAGGRFALLGFAPEAGPHLRELTAAHAELVESHLLSAGPGGLDDAEQVKRAFDADDDTLVLVRPDHHIALTTTTAGVVEVSGYLDRLSRRPAIPGRVSGSGTAPAPAAVAGRGGGAGAGWSG